MHLVLEIVRNYEFLHDHEYLDHHIIFSIHAIIEVKICDVYVHVSGFDFIDHAVYMQFQRGQILHGGNELSWKVYDITSCSESCSVSF